MRLYRLDHIYIFHYIYLYFFCIDVSGFVVRLGMSPYKWLHNGVQKVKRSTVVQFDFYLVQSIIDQVKRYMYNKLARVAI